MTTFEQRKTKAPKTSNDHKKQKSKTSKDHRQNGGPNKFLPLLSFGQIRPEESKLPLAEKDNPFPLNAHNHNCNYSLVVVHFCKKWKGLSCLPAQSIRGKELLTKTPLQIITYSGHNQIKGLYLEMLPADQDIQVVLTVTTLRRCRDRTNLACINQELNVNSPKLHSLSL